MRHSEMLFAHELFLAKHGKLQLRQNTFALRKLIIILEESAYSASTEEFT
ncbi:hypothetical protein [Virgibacillus sp. JSM 102003]